ncbi:MAG: 2-oxoglutarate oxidoreductase [Planctomycetes bacterium]|nr:2-oxoglutarate oxidoreductase [Planctomycetota bacterium]MCP4770217.1 2-oxoglutarate oxidoreductase [Planctomycetota bacterium]MCP4860635.1 2-oxoglutarate oxidoreductase [Planctomycetota bacterium]
MSSPCSILECGTTDDRHFEMDDYAGTVARWCPGCGDHAILTAVHRLLANGQMKPENTVFVSGIGCSSRFPHYVETYGFHGIHGRALPIATGVKLSRPELDVFVTMGDGDCCSIGAGHWIHAIRYNIDMTVLLLDNNIYGLTKKQTSPTTPQGLITNTQTKGSFLPPLDPLQTTLGVTNASFVAQTADWMPSHLAATLQAAKEHKGFSFVRILQRCPVFTPDVFTDAIKDPDVTDLLTHDDGIHDATAERIYKSHLFHDPSDITEARRLAEGDRTRVGLFFRDESFPRYEDLRAVPKRTPEEKIAFINAELDRHAV